LRRLLSQRLIQRDLETPADVARWFGAVQCQDLQAGLFGVGLRMKSATAPAVEAALADRTIVRTWPMRGTLHFVPGEDARWMTRLLGRRVNRKYAGNYRKAGLSAESFSRARSILVKALRDGTPRMRPELARALKEARLAATSLAATFLLVYWAQEGLLCQGPRQGKQQTFVLLDQWLPSSRGLARDEALATLARRYFTSHGPATARDFAWWTGMTLAEARRAIQACGPDLAREELEGADYWSAADRLDGDVSPNRVLLLPAFDELTVAYKDRAAYFESLPPKDSGVLALGPTVFVDGRIVGSWRRSERGKAVSVQVRSFGGLARGSRRALAAAARDYGRFLGKPVHLEV